MISRRYTTEQSLARFSHSGVACYRREVSDYFALFKKDAIQIMTVYEVKEGRE